MYIHRNNLCNIHRYNLSFILCAYCFHCNRNHMYVRTYIDYYEFSRSFSNEMNYSVVTKPLPQVTTPGTLAMDNCCIDLLHHIARL